MISTLLWMSLAFSQAPTTFDTHFTGTTLRFDYFHSGTAGEEHISLDRLRQEGDWPGSRTRMIDDTQLGKYLFEVLDADSGTLLYSRGFASIYGEWETTGEARGGSWRTFHESQRFPEPRKPVRLVLKKRDAEGGFVEFFSTSMDPNDRGIDRSALTTAGTPWTVFETGPPAKRVDLLILGDGYGSGEQETFHQRVKHLTAQLFASEPFKSHRGDFNVRAVDVVSQDSGITDPRTKTWHQTALGLSYDAFGSERYVLTEQNRAIREVAALAPYDALILLANNEKYGGGGIFNLWTTAAAGSGQADYLVVHEFGHSFAGLADEYYTSPVSYEDFNAPGVEPWEPNITALLDPKAVKWGDLVPSETPLPTPWSQAEYDVISRAFQAERQELRSSGASEERMNRYFAEVKKRTEPLLAGEKYAPNVGAFEGAGYQAKGLYRSSVDCIMFTRNPEHFCPVCSRAIEKVIALYTE
ncbi:MAG: IgA Peptidase M64 [Deltaproteobacteria bacterium]|nr:IgA Peptidase M64 [Deltaproteobacteria bacterium]